MQPAIAPGAAERIDGVRILIIDDSVVVRSVLARILGARPGFHVAAALGGVGEALAYLRTASVDIILLDIEMPDRSGLEALPDIIAVAGEARVLVLSSQCERGGTAAMRALASGACDTLAKPGRESFAGRFSTVLVERIEQLVRAGLGDHPRGGRLPHSATPASGQIACILLGSSTGGIPALCAFLSELDAHVTAPILVTQHLPATFMPLLVRQLSEAGGRDARLAEAGMTLDSSSITVARGEAHLGIAGDADNATVVLQPPREELAYTPMVDPMLSDAAKVFGARAVGVILSGMGRDGLLGAERLVAAGASIFVQDPASSTVWGMPGVVARAGLADAVLPPAMIAREIARLWGREATQ